MGKDKNLFTIFLFSFFAYCLCLYLLPVFIMADKSKTIIVKKMKKGHEGGHGGSWKGCLCRLCHCDDGFFPLMWLLAMVSPEKRAAMAEYFKEYRYSKKAGNRLWNNRPIYYRSRALKRRVVPARSLRQVKRGNCQDFSKRLKKGIDEKLLGLKEHLMVDIVEDGVRIQLVDTEGKPLFHTGSAELSPSAKTILNFVADNIKDMTNKIAVEGHTDSSPLKTQQYTNWELSTERA